MSLRRFLCLLAAILAFAAPALHGLHAEDADELCLRCDESTQAPRLECGDADCSDEGHHHHRAPEHHPATCRLCAAGAEAVAEFLPSAPAAVALAHVALEAAAPGGTSPLLWGPIRAPPAPAGSRI